MNDNRVKTDRVHKSIKSQNNEQRSFVTFVNRTTRIVDVCWVNYKSEMVHYNTMAPGCVHHMNTFVSHPWVFKDHNTGDRLAVAGQEIYYPAAWDGGNQRTKVYIDIPAFPLTIRCMQILKQIFPKEEFEKLEIPVSLIEELQQKQNRPCPKRYVNSSDGPHFINHDQAHPPENQQNDGQGDQ